MSEFPFKNPTRRDFTRGMLGLLGSVPLTGLSAWALPQKVKRAVATPQETLVSAEDDQFLDEIERAAFQYFWEQGNPTTGLIRDRCNTRANEGGNVASIAATGFGLTAICIGVSFITGLTLTRANGFGTRKFRRWIPPFFCAVC
jgi:hypothetical protein